MTAACIGGRRHVQGSKGRRTDGLRPGRPRQPPGELRPPPRRHEATKTARIYLDALDNLIRHLESQGMPTAARAVRREHVESYLAARRDNVAPSTLSLEYRALVQFFKWAARGGRDRAQPDGEDATPAHPRRARARRPGGRLPQAAQDRSGQGLHEPPRHAVFRPALRHRHAGRRAGRPAVADVDLRGRLAYVTGKGGHVRAVRFGAQRQSSSTATSASAAPTGSPSQRRSFSASVDVSSTRHWRS